MHAYTHTHTHTHTEREKYIELWGCWMLESDWLMNVLMCDIILGTRTVNVVPGRSCPHYLSSISLRQVIWVISKVLTAKEPKPTMTLAKQINIVNNRIKRQIICHKIMFYVRKAHTLSLPLTLPHRRTYSLNTHVNMHVNDVSTTLTILSVTST